MKLAIELNPDTSRSSLASFSRVDDAPSVADVWPGGVCFYSRGVTGGEASKGVQAFERMCPRKPILKREVPMLAIMVLSESSITDVFTGVGPLGSDENKLISIASSILAESIFDVRVQIRHPGKKTGWISSLWRLLCASTQIGINPTTSNYYSREVG